MSHVDIGPRLLPRTADGLALRSDEAACVFAFDQHANGQGEMLARLRSAAGVAEAARESSDVLFLVRSRKRSAVKIVTGAGLGYTVFVTSGLVGIRIGRNSVGIDVGGVVVHIVRILCIILVFVARLALARVTTRCSILNTVRSRTRAMLGIWSFSITGMIDDARRFLRRN